MSQRVLNKCFITLSYNFVLQTYNIYVVNLRPTKNALLNLYIQGCQMFLVNFLQVFKTSFRLLKLHILGYIFC